MFGLVALGYLWTRMAEVASGKVSGGESLFYQAKIDTAHFYFERLLPQCDMLHRIILTGSGTIMQFNDEAFEI